jgi:3-isopropylmalate/(R)-2-methylmalate dehydratase small subunit
VTEKNEIKNLTKNQIYSMKPFPELIGKIIAAGGLFNYKP